MTATDQPWYLLLDSDQLRRFSEVVDSRVRLLGESYGAATRAVQRGDTNREWIEGRAR
jgi:hypothetical protein